MTQTVTFLSNGKVRISGLTNSDIRRRNFGGEAHKFTNYDTAGNAYFNVGLTGDSYDALVKDGWDAFHSERTNDNGETTESFGEHVSIDRTGRSKSIIWQVDDPDANGKRHKKLISVDDLDVLGALNDYKFDEVELILRGWEHPSGRFAGLKAMYLEQMIFTLQKPEFSSAWGDVFSDELDGEAEELPFD